MYDCVRIPGVNPVLMLDSLGVNPDLDKFNKKPGICESFVGKPLLVVLAVALWFRGWCINEEPEGDELFGYMDPEAEEALKALGFEFEVEAECEFGIGFDVEFA